MRIAYRVFSIVFTLLALEAGLARSLGGRSVEQEITATSTFSQLKAILSRLYPIEHWTVSTTPDVVHPFVPQFCWEFFRADPKVLGRLGETFRNYRGTVSWMVGPPSGGAMCLVASEQLGNHFVGYPPMDLAHGLPTRKEGQQQVGTNADFIQRALADVPNLCAYLEEQLGLRGVAEKSFDPALIAPPEPPSNQSTPVDFVEPGMYVAWIVRNKSIEVNGHNRSPSTDKYRLHFSVTEPEWRTIRSKILSSISRVGDPARRQDETALFPLLARIEVTESTYFRSEEVAKLREECLRARAIASDPLAIRGLDKLILICNWARHLNGGIFLGAP